MSSRTELALTLRRVLLADRKTTFRAWTEPEQLERWAAPKGMEVREVDVGLMVGSPYRIVLEDPEGARHVAVGRFQEIERPQRLVFTFDWEGNGAPMGETLVRVELDRDGEDATELLLTHRGFPTEDLADNHELAWESCLDRLEQLLA